MQKRLLLRSLLISALLFFPASPNRWAAAAVTMPPGAFAVPTSGMFLYLNSEAGDYIGGGVEQLYTSPAAAIVASLPPGGDLFRASVTQGTHAWQVWMAAQPGQTLAPGSYVGATRDTSTSRVAPGLSVFGDGRACNSQAGRFDVSEVSFAPTGELLVFDATFEQHCEGLPPALFGRIRIENPPPTPGVTLPSGSLTIPTAGNFLYLISQPGDYIGQGREQLYTAADSSIKGLFVPGTDYFSGWVVQGNYVHFWSVLIAAAPGESLAAGSYISAMRTNYRTAGHPGLDVSGDGSGCNTLTGKFDVDEISFWPTGDLKVFQSTFEQHCSGAIPALFGRIRIETPAPLPTLEMTVKLRDEGNQDNKTGVATISGVVSCSRAATVDINGTLSQVFANKVSVFGTYMARVECAAPSTNWSATVIPYGQGFNSGAAQATVELNSCDYFHCYYSSAASTVKLNAGR